MLLEGSLVSCGGTLEGVMVLGSFKVSIVGGSPLSSLANTIAQALSQTAMDSKVMSPPRPTRSSVGSLLARPPARPPLALQTIQFPAI